MGSYGPRGKTKEPGWLFWVIVLLILVFNVAVNLWFWVHFVKAVCR
jgi:hypothetical protein